jgi:hypothetical protein
LFRNAPDLVSRKESVRSGEFKWQFALSQDGLPKKVA